MRGYEEAPVRVGEIYEILKQQNEQVIFKGKERWWDNPQDMQVQVSIR